MASGTTEYSAAGSAPTLSTTAWTRIDGSNAYVSGIVGDGSVLLQYVAGTADPGAAVKSGLPFGAGDPFSFSMGAADSLWARAAKNQCTIIVVGRVS